MENNKQIWQSFALKNFEFSDTSKDKIASYEEQLLNWCVFKYSLKMNSKENRTPFLKSPIYQFLTKLKYKNNELMGCGRALHRRTAASQSIGEILEQMVMLEVFKQDTIEFCHRIHCSKKNKWEILKLQKKETLPQSRLGNSNGWAVYFDLSKSVDWALKEALERHILQLTLSKYGWKGFYCVPSGNFEGFDIFSLFSRVEIAGYRAGMIFIKALSHKGGVFGFLCDQSKKFEMSNKWAKAFFEAYDQVLFFEKNKNQSPMTQSLYPLEKHQYDYLINSPPSWDETDSSLIEKVAKLNGCVLSLDLSKGWGLDFPLYASFVSQGDLLPSSIEKKVS